MGETLNLLGIAVPPRRKSATRRDSTQFKRVSRQETAREAIDSRRKEFETTMLDDDNLLSLLSVVYGPNEEQGGFVDFAERSSHVK